MKCCTINISDWKAAVLMQVMKDKSFWPGRVIPKSTEELVRWMIDDLIDYYLPYKKGG